MTKKRWPEDNRALSFETAGDKNSDRPLILLHGFTGTHHTWDAIADRLAREGEHFLVMPDLPGHGGSTAAEMDLDLTCIALARVLDGVFEGTEEEAAAEKKKKTKVAMLGYSLGGRVALNFALKYPDRVSALILESSSPGILDSNEREERRSRDDKLAGDIEQNGVEWFVEYWQNTPLFAAQKKSLEPPVFQRIRRDRLSNTSAGLASSLRSAGTGRMNPVWERLPEIEIPVLLVIGDGDETYTRIGKAMKNQIRRCSMVVIEGSGHCVHVEKPAEFGDAVERFLEGRLDEPIQV